MEKIDSKKQIKRSKTPDNRNITVINYEKLSEYIKLNTKSFQYLENKNFALAKIYFAKSMEISKEIDQIKYIESLINYSLSLYYNNEILSSYDSLKKAKDLSFSLYKSTEEINQIYFIYLRILCNMCLISLNLNKVSESKQLFNKAISLIKDSKITDIIIQISMLRELIYIFYRIDSLSNFQEINEKNIMNIYANKNKELYNNINSNINLDDKAMYYLYKSLRNNDLNYWLK